MTLSMRHMNMTQGNQWKPDNKGSYLADFTRKELKRKLYRAVTNVNILEGIRFYVSFACSFAFGELKLMEGSAKIISLIARDENQHLAITQNIINNWRKGDDPEMKEIVMTNYYISMLSGLQIEESDLLD